MVQSDRMQSRRLGQTHLSSRILQRREVNEYSMLSVSRAAILPEAKQTIWEKEINL